MPEEIAGFVATSAGVFWSAVAAVTVLVAGHDGSSTVKDDSSLAAEAAHAALIQLRSSVGASGPSSSSTYYLAPSQRPLTEVDLVRALVQIPKPIRCQADILPDGVRVRTFALQDSAERELQRLGGDLEGRGFVDYVRNSYGCHAPKSRVMLRGPRQSLIVSLMAVEALMRDYQIAGEVGSAPPDAEALAGGACAQIIFRQTGTISVETRSSPP